MSLHFNCLGFNSLIFRSTGKFVTPFLSIGSEVTTFFIFSKFAFLPSETAGLLFSSVVYWTNGRKEQRATNPIPHPCTDKKSQYLRAPRCYILSIKSKRFPLRSILRRQPARTTLRFAPSPPLRFGPAGVLVRHPAD